MADISTLTAESRTIDIVHPKTQEPIGLKIDLLPMTSRPVRDIERKWTNDNIKNGRYKAPTAEKLEAKTLELIVAATAGWTWGKDSSGDEATFEGGKPEFTPDNVRRVYKKLPWIRKQVDEALGDDAEFFRGEDASAE